jgi:hypothetical protein
MESENYKNYFLGLMSAQAVEALELRIISDDGIEAELLQAENDLIENFIADSLTNEETKAFNRHFLVTNERRERVAFVRLMQKYADNQTVLPENKPSFFEQLKAFVAIRPPALALALLALILCLGIGWQIIFNSKVNVADAELIGLNKQNLSNLDEFKTLKNLSLASGAARSNGNTSSLAEKDLTEKVLVRLALPNSSNSTQNFIVKISKDGKLFQTFNQNSYQNQEVRLLLPKSVLTKGDYRITLENNGEKYNYYFVVE